MAKSARGSGLIGELSAEFAGTMILILFGVGVVAQVVAGGALTNPPGGLGNHDSIAWAWGLGVTLGVYLAARLSGAHLNPAVTLTLAAFKGFPWQKVAPVRRRPDRRRLRGSPAGALELHRGAGQGGPGPHHQDPVRLLHASRQRQRGRRRARVGRLPRPGHRHRHPAAPDPGASPTCSTTRPGPTSGRSSSAWSSWPSAWRGAPTPGTRSTPRVTSAPGWPASSPDTAGPGGTVRGNLYFWVPIVGPLVGGLVGGVAYKLFVGRFLPTAEPEPAGRTPAPEA